LTLEEVVVSAAEEKNNTNVFLNFLWMGNAITFSWKIFRSYSWTFRPKNEIMKHINFWRKTFGEKIDKEFMLQLDVLKFLGEKNEESVELLHFLKELGVTKEDIQEDIQSRGNI